MDCSLAMSDGHAVVVYCVIKLNVCFSAERPDFDGGLILRRGCTVEHVVCSLFKIFQYCCLLSLCEVV